MGYQLHGCRTLNEEFKRIEGQRGYFLIIKEPQSPSLFSLAAAAGAAAGTAGTASGGINGAVVFAADLGVAQVIPGRIYCQTFCTAVFYG